MKSDQEVKMSKAKSDIEPGEASKTSDTARSEILQQQQQPGHGPQDIKMKAFSTSENSDETGQRWVKWEKELLTRFRFFRITSIEDQIDAINIYGGELIRELIGTLQDAPECDGAEHNEFEKIIVKLDNYFIRITNSDSARSKFAEMSQNNGESVAQYHFRLRFQAAKCNFPDINDAIRSKLLQTMTDGRLRREAMVKSYSLEELLKHAANKEDIDRQAKSIERSLQSTRVDEKDVNRVFEKKSRYVKQRKSPSQRGRIESGKQAGKACSYCGMSHENQRSSCPAAEKKCYNCLKTGHFARMCRAPKKQPAPQQHHRPTSKTMAKYLSEMEKEEENAQKDERGNAQKDDSSDSDFAFKTETTSASSLPTVQVRINGVKGQVEADSCSTANIIDEERFGLLQMP